MVCTGHDRFHVRGDVCRQEGALTIEAHWWKGEKRFKINGVTQSRVSDILGRLCVAFFSPEDVYLVRGTAALRRRFLDIALSSVDASYLHALQDYRHALRQRNRILREPGTAPALLDAWDGRLADSGTILVRERTAFVKPLAEYVTKTSAAISPNEALSLAYCPSVSQDASLHEVLLQNRALDLRHGVTMRGPHRDDLEFLMEGRGARRFASQGQHRTAALSLKLAELQLVRERIGEYPVLLLDDVFSELDAKRSAGLFAVLDPQVQCLLTTADAASMSNPTAANRACWRVHGGRIEKA